MKTLFLIIPASILFILGSCNSRPDLKSEEQKIKKLYNDLCAYAANGNWAEYSNLMKKDSSFQIIHPNMGQWLHGYQDFAKQYEPMIKQGLKAEFIAKDFKIYFSEKADVAWGTIDLLTKINSPDTVSFTTWNVFVVEKINNEWKWVLFNQSIPQTRN